MEQFRKNFCTLIFSYAILTIYKYWGRKLETLYDILEVSRKASKEVIEKAYKTLAKKYHPDLQTPENKEYAEKRMKEINEAYDVLSDEQKRKEYDARLETEEEQKKQEEYQNYQNNYNMQTNNSGNFDKYSNAGNSYKSNIYNENYAYNKNSYSETNSNNYNSARNSNNSGSYNADFDWRKAYANLSPKEQRKIMKEVQKEANAEYRKQYEDYFRSLGYKIKHRWTFKDFLTILLVIGVLAIIVGVLWIIPPTHNYMINLYNTNFIVKIIVDIINGMVQGIIKFFKNFNEF